MGIAQHAYISVYVSHNKKAFHSKINFIFHGSLLRIHSSMLNSNNSGVYITCISFQMCMYVSSPELSRSPAKGRTAQYWLLTFSESASIYWKLPRDVVPNFHAHMMWLMTWHVLCNRVLSTSARSRVRHWLSALSAVEGVKIVFLLIRYGRRQNFSGGGVQKNYFCFRGCTDAYF